MADANAARPVTAGGIGASTAVGGLDNLNAAGASIASGSTVNLANATGGALTITGTVTINSFGTVAAGAERVLTFAAALTLTYNATSMILPGAASIVTAAGDVATMRSLGGGNWQCVTYQRASGQPVAGLISPNITGPLTQTDTGTTLQTITSTDAGAGNGPVVNLMRDSASPAANDLIGTISFLGRDSGAASQSYAQIDAQIVDPTAASEDARIRLVTTIAGAAAARAYIGAGLFTASATGGDKGADTVNASAYYSNGAQLPFSKAFESSQQTITTAGSLTLAHSLGASPKLAQVSMICQTAERNYSIGDELIMNPSVSDPGSNGHGFAITVDATNVNIRFSNNSPLTGFDKSSGLWGGFTNANWKLVVRAWA